MPTFFVREQLESLSHAPVYNGPPIRPYIRHFKALLSTGLLYGGADNARDHTGTTYSDDDPGVPIYYLSGSKHGEKVADDYKDFYDGKWDTNEARDSYGQRMSGPLKVLTRSDGDGTYEPGTDSDKVRYGDPSSSDRTKGLFGGEALTSDDYLLYGISPVFQVREETPDDRSATGLTATVETARAVLINLTWEAPAAGTPVSYRIERSDGTPSKSWRTVLLDTGSSDTATPDFSSAEHSRFRSGFEHNSFLKYSFPEAKPVIEKEWCYRVRALYADGSEGPPSEYTCIGGPRPASPRNPRISQDDQEGTTNKVITMSWDAPSDAIDDTIYRVVFRGYNGIKGSVAVSGQTSAVLTSSSNLGTSLHANLQRVLFGGSGTLPTCYPRWQFSSDPDNPGPKFMSNGDVPCDFRIGFQVYAIRGSGGSVSEPVPFHNFSPSSKVLIIDNREAG